MAIFSYFYLFFSYVLESLSLGYYLNFIWVNPLVNPLVTQL